MKAKARKRLKISRKFGGGQIATGAIRAFAQNCPSNLRSSACHGGNPCKRFNFNRLHLKRGCVWSGSVKLGQSSFTGGEARLSADSRYERGKMGKAETSEIPSFCLVIFLPDSFRAGIAPKRRSKPYSIFMPR
jgi:hypothetical protein